MKCMFLGKVESESLRIEAEKIAVESVVNDEKTEVTQTENVPAAFCSFCNAKMSHAKTTLKVDGWELAEGDFGKLREESLPVIVCLCPKCGKIEFKADQK